MMSATLNCRECAAQISVTNLRYTSIYIADIDGNEVCISVFDVEAAEKLANRILEKLQKIRTEVVASA